MIGTVSYRAGALEVVQAVSARDTITRQLREIDRNLFLELQITLKNERVWCVVEHVGGDRPPVTVFEWRDELGRPIPYPTEGIVERFREKRHRLETSNLASLADAAAREAEEHNARKRERQETQYRQDAEDVTRDVLATLKKGSNGAIPRSPALAAARRRARARGLNERSLGGG